MPGVSTSRKCDGCRRRKKKCDLRKPSCSRCAHLGIRCVGSGEMRWKFIDGVCDAVIDSSSSSSSLSEISSSLRKSSLGTLSSKSTSTQLSFIRILQESDVRFQITLWGDFLHDLPSRLDSSPILEACAEAVVQSFISFRANHGAVPAIESYSTAITALRCGLSDPSIASSMDTICAVYLLIICQALMGEGLLTVHGEALSHMLRNASHTGIYREDEFAKDLLLTLSLPVILESIVNPRIKLGPWIESLIEERESQMPIHSLRFLQIGRLREYLHEPFSHQLEIQNSWQRTTIERLRMRKYFLEAVDQLEPCASVHLCAAYALAMTYAVILHGIILRCFDSSPYMFVETQHLLDDIMHLAEHARRWRPLGSSAMLTMLIAAWAVDPERRPDIEELLHDYTTDFPMVRWQESARWADAAMYGVKVDRRPFRLSTYSSPQPETDVVPQERDAEIAACLIM